MADSSLRTLVVMGVSGSGKSLVGELLAKRLGAVFGDGDDFHPPANKEKQAAKIPLTDEDRQPWLEAMRAHIEKVRTDTPLYVLACSALKEKYRETLRGSDNKDTLEFVYLKGTKELIGERLAARKGHFFPAALLDSQFATLEEPEDVLTVNVDQTPEEIVEDVVSRLA